MKKNPLLLLAVTLIISFSACKKSKDDFKTEDLSAYYPLETGKYITYSLDSTVFTDFGAGMVVHSYQVKYVTDAQITDNLGRPGYRIIRYIRSAETAPWQSDATFMAVNTSSSLEFIENNLRYIKLRQPVRNDYSWKGNSYIETYSANTTLKYLDDWDYIYENVDQPDQVGTFALDSCLTVTQRDEIINDPSNPDVYSEINYGLEKYANGIGMVYRKFFHSEYQPPTGGVDGFFVSGSYGVELTMIDHN